MPAAFAILAAAPDDPWLACRMAASVGGDTDTHRGHGRGGRRGVPRGGAFPAAARGTLPSVNGLRLDEVAAGLLALRAAQ